MKPISYGVIHVKKVDSFTWVTVHLDPELNEPDDALDIVMDAQRSDPEFFSLTLDTTV